MDNKKKLQEQIKKSAQQYQAQEYQQLVNQLNSGPPVLRNAVAAFSVGGFICAFAQAILNLLIQMGLAQKEASSATTIVMIFLGAFLTGLGIYDNIGKFAGAGSIIPITGFSNSIVSSAMEWKREGYIFGVGAKMFTIAGPVLVYGFISSVIIGLIYYFVG